MRGQAEAGRVYAVLVALHPREFRQSFGGEMLALYEDALEVYGARWLLRDAAASLVRQWVLRWPEKEVIAGTGGYMGLMSGTYPEFRPPHLTAGKLGMAFVVSAMLYGLIGPM